MEALPNLFASSAQEDLRIYDRRRCAMLKVLEDSRPCSAVNVFHRDKVFVSLIKLHFNVVTLLMTLRQRSFRHVFDEPCVIANRKPAYFASQWRID